MPQLAESKIERLTYKFYTTGAIDSTTEPDMSIDPGAGGGQVLRHVSHGLVQTKENYRPDEKRQDRQKTKGRHGTRRVSGPIAGVLSPTTYFDFFEAVLRGTRSVAAITASETDFTSVLADKATSKFVFAGGDPVAKGFRVGDPISFSLLSDPDNNGVTYVIRAFEGISNRTMYVDPAPDTMSADIAFSMTSLGRSVMIPPTGHVDRKALFEVYNGDSDLARLFTECRIGGFDFSAAPNADATINFNLMGRRRQVLDGATAPFFAAPGPETATDVISGMNGLFILNGQILGVATGISIKCNLNPSAPAGMNRNKLVPAVFLDDAVVDGEFTVFLDGDNGATVMSAFDDEAELSLLCHLPVSEDLDAPAITIFLPLIKINSNSESDAEGGKAIQCQFEASRYFGSAPGVESTTIRICDTEIT